MTLISLISYTRKYIVQSGNIYSRETFENLQIDNILSMLESEHNERNIIGNDAFNLIVH